MTSDISLRVSRRSVSTVCMQKDMRNFDSFQSRPALPRACERVAFDGGSPSYATRRADLTSTPTRPVKVDRRTLKSLLSVVLPVVSAVMNALVAFFVFPVSTVTLQTLLPTIRSVNWYTRLFLLFFLRCWSRQFFYFVVTTTGLKRFFCSIHDWSDLSTTDN